jgi:hypothetical protein
MRARFEVVLDPVACAAVPTGAASAGDGFPGGSSAGDGGFDLGLGDGHANAHVHAVLKIMKPVFIIKGDRGILSSSTSVNTRDIEQLDSRGGSVASAMVEPLFDRNAPVEGRSARAPAYSRICCAR